MSLKALNEPLSWKSALKALALLVTVVIIYFAGRAVFSWSTGGPSSPAGIKRQIRSYLKKQTGKKDFTAPFDFTLKDTINLMHTNGAALRTQIAALQTNLAGLRTEVPALRRSVESLRGQERLAKREITTVEELATDRQKRALARQQELAMAQSNLVRFETNLAVFKASVAATQALTLQITNEITALQTNLASLQGNLALLQTNLLTAQTEAKTKARELLGKERELKALRTDLAAKQTRLIQNTNVTERAGAVANLQTNLATLELEIPLVQQAITNANQTAASVQTNLVALQKEIATAQKAIAAKTQEAQSLRATWRDKLTDVAQREARWEALKNAVAAAEAGATAAQTNATAVQTSLAAKRSAWEAKSKELAAQQALLAEKQKALNDTQTAMDTAQKDLVKLQRELLAKENLLARQHLEFAQTMRKQSNQAQSYEDLYVLIGQQLWLVDKFLAGSDVEQHRAAMRLVTEASQSALSAAENAWLAARICQAYLWPNLELKDHKGARLNSPEDMLQYCSTAFTRAEETNNVIANLRLTLQYASNNNRADQARYYLANWLEQTAAYDEAIQLLRQIQNTNLVRYADQRLPVLERKRDQRRASR